MKFTKLSLAAMIAMGVASSAFAVDNLKVDGQVKVWYQTTDTGTVAGEANTAFDNDGLFKKDGAKGDLVAKLRATGNFNSKIGFGTTLYAVSTMGLENNLVSDEAIGYTTSDGRWAAGTALNGSDKMPMWLGEAYVTYKMGNTIAKIGRQELDTPLAFTETWNAAPNTFEAAVLVNQDLPDTTLVAAYVSRGNGQDGSSFKVTDKTVQSKFSSYHANGTALSNAGYVGGNGDTGGAYALGMVNKSIPGLTIHPVYYNVVDTATAGWIDLTYAAPYGIKLEGLYSYVEASGVTEKALEALSVKDKKTDAYAVKVSGALYDVNLAASYSSVSAGVFPIANTATNFTKTKLYTASILSDGRIAAQPDVSAWKLEASTKYAGFDFGASYASYDVKENKDGERLFDAYGLSKDKSPSEFDFSVGTKIDEVNLTAYYIMQSDYSTPTTGTEARDRTAFRVIASINF